MEFRISDDKELGVLVKKNKVNIKRLETYSLLEKCFNNHSSKIIQLMDEIKYLNNQILHLP